MALTQQRGQLTERVMVKAKELLGYEITQTELRLMPYLHYIAVNEQYINAQSVNDTERDIIAKWQDQGRLVGYQNRVRPTKEFWDAMSQLIYLAYVDITIE